jgi:hypothetical protein
MNPNLTPRQDWGLTPTQESSGSQRYVDIGADSKLKYPKSMSGACSSCLKATVLLLVKAAKALPTVQVVPTGQFEQESDPIR